MPIYEYQCQNCQHRFEEIQKFSDPELLNCPQCNKTRLQRLISLGSFHLKGGGWYLTDSRTDSGNENNKVASESSSGKTSSE